MTEQFTPEMIAEARAHPGGHVFQIDWPYPDDQAVPPDAIVGGWKVDQSGELTGEFVENPNYRPVKIAARKPQEYMMRVLNGSGFRNQWVAEIDPAHHDNFPNVPDEWMVGLWYVGSDGKYTGQFRPNHKYVGTVET